MNGDNFERISQESQRQNEAEGGILESASAFAQRVLEEIETLAGTTNCKTVQLVRLKQWALEQDCWFDDCNQFGDYFDRGSENEVYLSFDQKSIVKLNDFRYADDNLTSFFERIKAHNKYFDISTTIYCRCSSCNERGNSRRVPAPWLPPRGSWRILHQWTARYFRCR